MNLAFGKHAFALGPNVEYGPGVHMRIGEIAAEWGASRAMIVTDPNMMRAGIVKMISDVLEANGLDVVIFDKILSEPTDSQVYEGVAVLRETGADLLVGLGGGSAMDAAKAIGVMAENPGKLTEYEQAATNFPNDKKVPLITLPTTSGSGAEIAGWSVITDSARSAKMSFGSPYLEPEMALVDPLLTMSLPREQTAYSGFDALSQAIEGMLSRRRTPLSVALGLYAVELISENLPRAVAHGWDEEARSNMSSGSLLAGIVINTSGCIGVHSLAETMGGIYHKPHGLLVGLCLPHILKFHLPGDHRLLARIAGALGVDVYGLSDYEAARLAIARVHQLLDELNFPLLSEIGLKAEDIPMVARLALGNACTPDDPCINKESDFVRILQDALENERPL